MTVMMGMMMMMMMWMGLTSGGVDALTWQSLKPQRQYKMTDLLSTEPTCQEPSQHR